MDLEAACVDIYALVIHMRNMMMGAMSRKEIINEGSEQWRRRRYVDVRAPNSCLNVRKI